MKREGRQHGMVRTYWILPSQLNPRPTTRLLNNLDSPATAGAFTRVSSKPTNHSKFTGKCGNHMHPASKAKDKTKGTQKIRSYDVVSYHRLVTWRGRQGLNFSGYSASAILDQLEDDDNDVYDRDADGYDGTCGMGDFDHVVVGFQIAINDGDDDENGNNVGDVMDQPEEDEDWCLVGKM
nr:uncharacterized protein LOC107415211 [Ziziphus jujuba var. spinosa]